CVVSPLGGRYEYHMRLMKMTLISDLKNVDGFFTTTLLVLFLSLIAPGVLIIYLFLPELFVKIDVFKLVLLSVSLALPTFILNGALAPLVLDLKSDGTVDFQMVSILSGIFSSILLYSCLVISYAERLEFSGFLRCAFFLEIIFVLFFCSCGFFRNRKQQSRNS
ncbi:hypothetical protein AB2327_18035, partial [Vibrio cholerae]|uniref:hypothetical protein n=1 Tax=Vibrio cholerae TaxID=666 RepID=UPI003F95F678